MNHLSIFVNGGVEKLIDAVASRLINFSIGKFSRPINHDIFFLVYDFFLDFSIIFITEKLLQIDQFFRFDDFNDPFLPYSFLEIHDFRGFFCAYVTLVSRS